MRPRLAALIVVVALGASCARAPLDRYVARAGSELLLEEVRTTTVQEGRLTRKLDVELVASDGSTFALFVREPLGADGRLPVVLLLAGFETGRAALDLVEERDDVIVASLDYPFEGERRLDLVGALALRRLAYRTLDAEAVALRWLSLRPDVDDERIAVVGVSFGAIFATPFAAYDERVDVLVLVYGVGDLPRVVARSPPPALAWLPRRLLAVATRVWIGDFDPLLHIERVAPRLVLMAQSTRDETMPISSSRRLFARAQEPKALLWYDTGHADLFDPRVVARVTAGVVVELEARRFLPAEATALPSGAGPRYGSRGD